MYVCIKFDRTIIECNLTPPPRHHQDTTKTPPRHHHYLTLYDLGNR